MAETNPRKIYVGNLPRDYTEGDLREDFSRFGEIRRIEFKRRTDLVNKPFGFVEYNTPTSATEAVTEMNGTTIGNERIQVKAYYYVAQKGRNYGNYGSGGSYQDGYRDAPRTPYRVIVSGLNERTNWQDLKDFGRKVGLVNFADVYRGPDGAVRGIIEFQESVAMNAALQRLSGTELLGSIVTLAQEKETTGSSTHGSKGSYPPSGPPAAETRNRPRSFSNYKPSAYDPMRHRKPSPYHAEYSRRGHRSRSPVYYHNYYNYRQPSYNRSSYHHPNPDIPTVRPRPSVSPRRVPMVYVVPNSGSPHVSRSPVRRRPYSSRSKHRSSHYPDAHGCPVRGGETPGRFSPDSYQHGHSHHHHHHVYPPSVPPSVHGSYRAHKGGNRPLTPDRRSSERRGAKVFPPPGYYDRRY